VQLALKHAVGKAASADHEQMVDRDVWLAGIAGGTRISRVYVQPPAVYEQRSRSSDVERA
jgi:hypothetical protein